MRYVTLDDTETKGGGDDLGGIGATGGGGGGGYTPPTPTYTPEPDAPASSPSAPRSAPTGPANDSHPWIPILPTTFAPTVAPPSAPSGGSRVGEYCTTSAGKGGRIAERFGAGGTLGYVCEESGEPAQTGGQAPASACPDGQSMLGAGSLRYYADGTSVRNTGGEAACYPNTPAGASAPADAPSGGGGAPTSGPSTGGGGGGTDDDTTIKRLMDLIAAQYAGAGVDGGGSGFGGLVSGPLEGAPEDVAPAASKSRAGLFIILAIAAAGLGYWYYRKHHKKAA